MVGRQDLDNRKKFPTAAALFQPPPRLGALGRLVKWHYCARDGIRPIFIQLLNRHRRGQGVFPATPQVNQHDDSDYDEDVDVSLLHGLTSALSYSLAVVQSNDCKCNAVANTTI